MSAKNSFLCLKCGKNVLEIAPGTKNRNHCPHCLYSLHVDIDVGDRLATCKGLMKPIGKILKKDGEESLIHKCEKCLKISKNRIAGDDSVRLVADLKLVDDLKDTG